jgi:hypothetical protein
MNSSIVNNLYLTWFSPDEFPLFYQEYKSRIKEFLVAAMSAFSLAVAGVYITPSHSYDAPFVIVAEFFAHLAFFSFFPDIIAYIIDYQARKMNVNGDVNISVSFVRYSLSILFLATPLAILFSAVKIQGSAGYIGIVFILGIICLINILRGASEIYGIDKSHMFKMLTFSFFLLITVPALLCFYYLFTLLSVVI